MLVTLEVIDAAQDYRGTTLLKTIAAIDRPRKAPDGITKTKSCQVRPRIMVGD